MKSLAALTLLLGACFAMAPAPAAYQPVDPAAVKEQQRQAFARSAGYPTNHSAADLQAMIDEQIRTYTAMGRRGTGELGTPQAVTIDGVRGTCYKVVMRLRDGAAWDRGAEAGLRFDFTSPSG